MVSMQQIKELRDRTQAGLNDCKVALAESDGDMEKAVEAILKKGLAKSAKRAGAVTSEGLVAAEVAADGKAAVIVEVNIQTDFAARNPEFNQFVESVVKAASAASDGADLSAQPFPGGSGSVEDARAALVGKLGENITVRRWARVSIPGDGLVHAYIHMGGKVGAVLGLSVSGAAAASNAAVREFAENTAMQIAAMAPLYLDRSEVPEAARKAQGEIFDAQLAEEGKPEAVRPKIIEGKINKWMKEVCLVDQVSVLDSEKTIDKQRAELAKAIGADVTITGFVRYERGEGIEKKEDDFAEEARKMAEQ